MRAPGLRLLHEGVGRGRNCKGHRGIRRLVFPGLPRFFSGRLFDEAGLRPRRVLLLVVTAVYS